MARIDVSPLQEEEIDALALLIATLLRNGVATKDSTSCEDDGKVVRLQEQSKDGASALIDRQVQLDMVREIQAE